MASLVSRWVFSIFPPNSDDLSEVHFHVVDLGDKDGSQRLVQCCSIHVDGCANWQHKAGHPLVNFIVLL